MIKYKGYVGVFEYDPEHETLRGRVTNSRDPLEFSGRSVRDLKLELAGAVEAYLAACRKRGRKPEKPYSGRFLVRAGSSLHRDVAVAAARKGVSMNEWVTSVLRGAVDAEADAAAAIVLDSGEAPARSWATRSGRRQQVPADGKAGGRASVGLH